MNNMNQAIDLVNNIMYNANRKGEIMKKERNPVPLEQKKKAVNEITLKHEEQGMPIPQACKEQGIEIYTYYNWKKRVDQLAARKRPVIVRKFPVAQAANPATIVQLPQVQGQPQKCAIIITDTRELPFVLKELNF